MNLEQTMSAMEAKNITVALDLGVHSYCDIDSNCPIAVQLRRLIGESGVTLEQLLEGFESITAPMPPVELPEFDCMLHLNIAEHPVEIDLKDVVSFQLLQKIERKMGDLEHQRARLITYATSLHNTSQAQIARARETRSLPQISFNITELLKSQCLITTDGGTDYILFFPKEYKPEYLIRDSIRYKMSLPDIKATHRDIFIEMTITRDYRFRRVVVLDKRGGMFCHYHGDRSYDCWGAAVIPQVWNGSLRSLSSLAHSLEMSLTTINMGSLLCREPSDMPDVWDMFDRSIELGKEGEISPTHTGEGAAWGDDAAPRIGWGRR